MKKKYFFTFRAIKTVLIVIGMIVVTMYFMEARVKKAINKTRDKKSLASGLEYFSKKFKFYDTNNVAYSLDSFSNSAVVVNYIDEGENSNKLILSQKIVLENLLNKDIVFLYIHSKEFFNINSFGLDDLINKKVYFLYDKNLSFELLDIKNYPYSLIFDNNHRLVGKVVKFQDWNSDDKINYLKEISY